ncbi:hypothetical protein COMA1_11083 [Candidatus Nitrospira nitrosa]|uniref:Uncharacterized protein n=1 Tax=Candidatus Nitrospira nitrosa TaxID=1742972 RepID=A0A0S4LBS9_9BACT|nr:hypothetical protein COMA1_11083 [Candidatus Nitrospira nitrosa]
MMNQYVPNQSVSLRPNCQVHSALSAHALSQMLLFIAFLPHAVRFELLVRCLHSNGGIIGMSVEGKELTGDLSRVHSASAAGNLPGVSRP